MTRPGVGSAPPPSHWLVLAALFTGTFIIGLTPIADGDIFWHLAAGREMVLRRDWLFTDPFTISAGGRPWRDVHWLFQLGVFAVFKLFAAHGLAALVVTKAVLVAAGAVVLARAVARWGAPGLRHGDKHRERADGRDPAALARGALCAIGLLASMLMARHLLAVRPVIVTLLMLAAFLKALEESRSGTARSLLWLPALQVVWANCQGLSALGPALVASYLVAAVLARLGASWGDRFFATEVELSPRALALTLAGCLLGQLATPYGWQTVTLPGELLLRVVPAAHNVFSSQIAENVAPWRWGTTAPREIGHLWWFMGAVALCLFCASERPQLSRILLVVGFAVLALMANRNVLLFYWVATPVAAAAVAPRLTELLARLHRRRPRPSSPRRVPDVRSPRPDLVAPRPGGVPGGVVGMAVAAVLAAQVLLAAMVHSTEGRINAPAAFHFPVQSVKVLRGLGAAGPVFAPDHHGGYLELMLPALRPYLDTRMILHTAAEYQDYLSTLDKPSKFDALAEAHHFRFVVLTTSYPDRYLRLIQHLAASPAWKLVFTDGSEVVFAREGIPLDLGDPTTIARILAELHHRFGSSSRSDDLTSSESEAARLNLARLLVLLEQPRQAQAVLALSRSRAAAQLRARAHLVAGELAAAESMARVLVAVDDQDVRSLALLAQLAALKGETTAATQWLRRALRAEPYDPESNLVLQSLERR